MAIFNFFAMSLYSGSRNQPLAPGLKSPSFGTVIFTKLSDMKTLKEKISLTTQLISKKNLNKFTAIYDRKSYPAI